MQGVSYNFMFHDFILFTMCKQQHTMARETAPACHLCMNVYMYGCMNVCMDVYMYACMNVCMYARMYVTHIRMYNTYAQDTLQRRIASARGGGLEADDDLAEERT